MLPAEATHSSLDLFEKAPLLVTFEQAFEQKIGPLYSPNGPNLEFEVIGDRNNFIDLQKIYLEIKCQIKQTTGDDLRYDAGTPANSDDPYLKNNSLHTLFSDCTVSANGLKISNSNGLYAHKSFIETEFSHSSDAKDTWLSCQGYEYENTPGAIDAALVTRRQTSVRQSATVTFYGKLAVDFFSCERHLVSGVSLRISLRRAANDFCIRSEDAGKHYQLRIIEANLFVRKMTITDHVVTAIEKTLLKTPAMYRYNEVLAKTFLATRGQLSWKHEDVFTREPIRRLAIAMNTNEAFLGTNVTNPFHYQKFDLEEIVIYRNGLPVAGTPLSTTSDKRLYFNSMNALAYLENGHGIPLSEFPNHFVMVFDLTSTLEASHDFIHPELTNSSIAIELKFGTALPNNVEILLLGEKLSTVYIDSARNISKNVFLTTGR